MLPGMNQTSESEVFTVLPCLACTSWRSDRLKTRLGAIYLALLRGERVQAMPLDQMLRGCCREPLRNIVATAVTTARRPGQLL
jgi:hypothetical protein